tara:strand:+ start:1389 stop:2288 length:900 start_codon:yes stop_codon:yes gene_type:complete
MSQLVLPNLFETDVDLSNPNSLICRVCDYLDNKCRDQCDIDEDYLRVALNLITQQMCSNENLFAKGSLWEICFGFAIGAQVKNSSRSHIRGSTSFDLIDKYGNKIELKTSSQLTQKGAGFFNNIIKGTQFHEEWSTINFINKRKNQELWYCKGKPVQILKCAYEPFILGEITVLNGNSQKQKTKHSEVLEQYLSSIGWDSICFVQTPKDYSVGSQEVTIYQIKKQDFIDKSFFKVANNNIKWKMVYNSDYVQTLYSSRICYTKESVPEYKTSQVLMSFFEKTGFNKNHIPQFNTIQGKK